VPEIIKTRLVRGVQKLLTPSMNRRRLDELPAAAPPDYLLIVSRVEPRKNHLTLLAAWERLRSTRFPALQLIAVGPLGSHHEPILRKFLPWVEQGAAHMLEDVPSADLRLLYKHARATVCPTVGEGFGFAGVEAMRCGGAVVASDIAVHREIYADAAVYFNLHDLSDAVRAIETVIDPGEPALRAGLVERGAQVSARYESAAIMPQWHAFLHTVMDPSARPA
jgi:glycosyltransferase involved in cell wall biosynthesis